MNIKSVSIVVAERSSTTSAGFGKRSRIYYGSVGLPIFLLLRRERMIRLYYVRTKKPTTWFRMSSSSFLNVNVHGYIKVIAELTDDDWTGHEVFILGVPTWYYGELQSDWEAYFEHFKTLDFSEKTVALFGLGDQWGYDEWFIDGKSR